MANPICLALCQTNLHHMLNLVRKEHEETGVGKSCIHFRNVPMQGILAPKSNVKTVRSKS